MYLSKLILNPREKCVLTDLADPYQMHRTVMSGFPKELPAEERVLYRLEIGRIEPCLVLLVQSHSQPEWGELIQKGYLQQPAGVKTFDYQCSNGQVYRFRLLANPTKRVKKNENGDSTRVGLQREADQLQWLNRKGEQHGFCVLAAQSAKFAQPEGWKIVNSRKIRISHYAVRFDGLLRVIDADHFSRALSQGIGSGKGMGFGLLSIAPAAE